MGAVTERRPTLIVRIRRKRRRISEKEPDRSALTAPSS
jgi:hypothetical protein